MAGPREEPGGSVCLGAPCDGHSHPGFPSQMFLVLLLTSLCLGVAAGFWAKTFQEKHSYLAALYRHTTAAQQAFLSFWGFTILLSIIVPMSMYIT